jgi:hypothetical protein
MSTSKRVSDLKRDFSKSGLLVELEGETSGGVSVENNTKAFI